MNKIRNNLKKAFEPFVEGTDLKLFSEELVSEHEVFNTYRIIYSNRHIEVSVVHEEHGDATNIYLHPINYENYVLELDQLLEIVNVEQCYSVYVLMKMKDPKIFAEYGNIGYDDSSKIDKRVKLLGEVFKSNCMEALKGDFSLFVDYNKFQMDQEESNDFIPDRQYAMFKNGKLVVYQSHEYPQYIADLKETKMKNINKICKNILDGLDNG